MPEPRVLEVPASARGERLDKFLARALAGEGLSRTRLRALLDQGGVHVDGEPRPPRHGLRGGERVLLEVPAPRPSTLAPADIPLDILYEDPDLLVVNKPAGLVTHPGAGHSGDTLANALLRHCAGPDGLPGPAGRPGIVHRLDKGTSGCLVAAKTPAAFAGLTALIAGHRVTRVYRALAWGVPETGSGTVDAAVGRGPDRKRMALRPGTGRPAVTHFSVRRRFSGACELECRLETGRTHQIRVHLAGIGHPVVGDPDYGRPPRSCDPAVLERLARSLSRQALHAHRLSFTHPVSGRAVDVRAPEPADFKAARRVLAAAP